MPPPKPLVTIGVCVRNSASTIREAIESIMKQDYPHELIEVIFVDDGSEDGTLAIIKEYAKKMDMKVKIFHHKWRGLGYSRNVVVNNASGDYIIWVDGDMVLPKDNVRRQIEFMEQNPTVGVAKAKYSIYPHQNLLEFLENISCIVTDFKYKGEMTDFRTLGTGGSIYRVEAIKQVGGFDINISGVGEDMDVEYKIRKTGWKLYRATRAFFYEKRRKTWRALWDENFWHGYGGQRIYVKRKNILSIYKMTPIAGFFQGIWHAIIGYRLFRRKAAFLLPFQYAYKRAAWCLGFIRGQLEDIKNGFNGLFF